MPAVLAMPSSSGRLLGTSLCDRVGGIISSVTPCGFTSRLFRLWSPRLRSLLARRDESEDGAGGAA